MLRIETGPLKPEGDWTGLFLRGDDAIALAASIRLCEKWLEPLPRYTLKNVPSSFAHLSAIAKLIERKVVSRRGLGRLAADGLLKTGPTEGELFDQARPGRSARRKRSGLLHQKWALTERGMFA
jgi:hypothetical protein